MTQATMTISLTPALRERLATLAERTADEALLILSRGQSPRCDAPTATDEERNNLVSTCLMETFKQSRDPEVFGLLYELNQAIFLRQIYGHLSRARMHVDPHDVLQDVFLNICRYPDRFVADRPDAFHGWAHRVVRNTALRCCKSESAQPLALLVDEEHPEPEDGRTRAPERIASDRESAAVVNQSYVLFLGLYQLHYERLAPRDQQVLHLAEIEGWRYRDIGSHIGVPVMNVKMTVFRSRQRILRGMAESLAAIERLESVTQPAPVKRRRRRARKVPAATT